MGMYGRARSSTSRSSPRTARGQALRIPVRRARAADHGRGGLAGESAGDQIGTRGGGGDDQFLSGLRCWCSRRAHSHSRIRTSRSASWWRSRPAARWTSSRRLLGPKLPDLLGQRWWSRTASAPAGTWAPRRSRSRRPTATRAPHASSAYAVNPTLIPNAGYDGEKDFVALAIVASQPNLILVHADFPAKTLAELIARAKTDKLAFASAGSGTTPHLTGENLFKVRAKVDITHIPFRGGGPAGRRRGARRPAAGGRDRRDLGPLPHIKAGKIRALAVSSARRRLAARRADARRARLRGMEDYTWIGYFVPAGTPRDIAQKLNGAVEPGAAPKIRGAWRPGLRRHRRAAGGDRGLREERARQVGQGGARGRRQGRLRDRGNARRRDRTRPRVPVRSDMRNAVLHVSPT